MSISATLSPPLRVLPRGGAFGTKKSMQSTDVLNALKSVLDPDLKKDVVSLGMIRDVEVSGSGAISLKVVLKTPADPLKEKFEADVRSALSRIPGAGEIRVQMTSEVKAANRALSHQGGERKAGSSMIQGVTHVIAVSSGKGGVGKSTVSVNLAMSLALDGARVGLMDADVYGPNIPTMMGVTEQPKIMKNAAGTEMFIPPIAHGIKVISMGMLVDPDQPLVWRGPMLHSVVNQFCHQVEWGTLDYLIVDMPPGTGDVQLSLAQMVPVTGAVLVTTPQEVSMQDVRKAHAMFEKVRIPILGFVENMSYFKPDDSDKKYFIFGEGGGKMLADKYRSELLGQIPIVPMIREGGDIGKPITVREPNHPTSQAFRAIARRVARKIVIMAEEGVDPAQLIQIGKFN